MSSAAELVKAMGTDDLEIMRLALAKYHNVEGMPELTKETVEGLHDGYMEEMIGTTPPPHKDFNPIFRLWEKVARKNRYLGFRNVHGKHINLRCPDAMPNLASSSIKYRVTDITHSVPTFPAMLAMLDTHNKIVEVGAGSGYLASHLERLGADIVCCDVNVEENSPKFHKVIEMDGRDFIRKHDGFPNRALLICWGYYKDGIPEQYEEMIKLFKGDFLYVIGEQRADLCTFCLNMCDPDVQNEWQPIGIYDLPAFEDHRLYDQLVVYKRHGVAHKEGGDSNLQMRPSSKRRDCNYL